MIDLTDIHEESLLTMAISKPVGPPFEDEAKPLATTILLNNNIRGNTCELIISIGAGDKKDI